MKDEALDLALEALILKTGMNPVMQGSCYVMHPEALQAVIDEAIKKALAAPVQEPVPAAIKTVVEAMQADPDYAWGWHCNIAMAFVDAGGDHYTGNQGAARFMKMLANVEPAHELPSPPQPAAPVQEPVAWMTQARNFVHVMEFTEAEAKLYGWIPVYTTPPAQPVIPDAMTSADIQEHIEYVAGWNDCRQAMMEMMK